MQDALLLAVETSSLHGSVALGRGAEVVAWRPLGPDRRHTVELFPAIRDELAKLHAQPADVGVVCVSQGPGSFTGLRIAATLARMWQSATGCAVVAVPSLEVIARNALAHPEQPARLAVIVDARQQRVFAAAYERESSGGADGLRVVAAAGLASVESWLAARPRPTMVLGDGAGMYAATVAAAGLTALSPDYWYPDARQVLAIGWRLAQAGQFCLPDAILPAYLRPPECEEVYEQRRAEAQAKRRKNSA